MIRIMTITLLLVTSAALAIDDIPWPMQPQDGWHTLFHSYGDYHRSWDEVTQSNPAINFHFGIDLDDPTDDIPNDEAEDVYCVRTGYVRDIEWGSEDPDPPADHDDYTIVICDIKGQQTGFGWAYGHIEDRLYSPDRGDP